MPTDPAHPPTTDRATKCACVSCHCAVPPGGGVARDGKVYCSNVCAYDCTETTCVCVHDRCDEEHDCDGKHP